MSKLSVRKFGVGVASLALVAGMGVSAQAADLATDPVTGSDRISGSDRVATSVEVAKKQYGSDANATTMYVVGYDAVVDAAVAGVLDAPVIIMPASASAQELLGVQLQTDFPNVVKLVAVGGKGVVSDEAVTALKKRWTNISSIDRLDGANRYETAVAVNKVKFKKASDVTSNEVLVTRGDNVVDALAAGALNSPVLLLNREGKVDPKVIEYYKSLNEPGVLVLGGTAALPDSQVLQLSDTIKEVDPWLHTASEPELKNDVKKAAALYYGQGKWQDGTDDLAGYFGLGTSDNNGVVGTSVDPTKINLTAKQASGSAANMFMGYKPSADGLAALKSNMTTHVTNLKKSLDDALEAAKTAEVTAGELGTAIQANNTNSDAATNAGKAERLAQAFKALYGKLPGTAAGAPGNSTATDISYLTFDGSTNSAKVTGIAGKIATESNTTYTTEVTTPAANATAAKAAISPLATGAAPSGASSNITVNWVVAQRLLDSYIEKSAKNEKDAKAELDRAVKAYRDLGAAKVVTGGGNAGADRIAGADRFETAALLSYYADSAGTHSRVVASATTAENRRVFLASGKDANLIDAVVAGQLKGGPILLVPATGDLPKSTAAEIKRLAKNVQNAADSKKPVAIGGTSAVADAVLAAALKIVKDNTTTTP